ncbi:Pre-mRNA-splicing factor cwc22 [Pichia kudriavzevii]|uniref:Pre-mRNA-splicing factor CWC22 n=1 Tax=Pichia kudriavzevii TaxID=4909 RepID=A0A1V2LKT3_PICKU|nr:Pre-mRNA-splicing factor cwc22 [Pichia kudriavzevii]
MSEKLSKLLKLKSGGAYVPPAKLRELMAQVELEENSKEFQILQWEALKKNINSSVNKVNKENLKTIVVELFKNNLLQGRGLLCQCIMKSQQLSTSYTDVYASLVSIINSKIPEVGDLLVRRLIVKFKRLIRRNEAEQCRSVVVFLSELFNFHVINSELVQQIIDKLFENISDFRIEMIIEIMRHCGITLHDENGKWFDQKANLLRNVLNENIVNPKSQYLIQEFFDNFKGLVTNYNGIDESLDLVEEEDQITHNFTLSENVLGDDHLDVFKFDPNYEDNREKYNIIRKGILGSDVETDSDQEVDNESSDYSSDYDNEEEEKQDVDDDDNRQYTDDKERNKLTVQIKDLTEQELTTFQKNVYLTIMSSMSPEEATHKLLKLPAVDPKRKEYMLVDMVIKCCAQEKIYSKYYGLIGENLAVINKSWAEAFQALFKENYQNCHRYETALLRNIGAFWGHMFASDKIGWECLSVIKLTEEDTTSSGRIFIKFIFQRMVDELGDKKLNERISEDYIQPFIRGLFPVDNPDHLRFSINYFTAIGMGKLTDKMRSNLNILTEKDKLITSLN